MMITVIEFKLKQKENFGITRVRQMSELIVRRNSLIETKKN